MYALLGLQSGGELKHSTIKDVANAAGVSIKTVSRVFNNEKYVSAVLRVRVIDAATSLDYVPHPSARSLASRRFVQHRVNSRKSTRIFLPQKSCGRCLCGMRSIKLHLVGPTSRRARFPYRSPKVCT